MREAQQKIDGGPSVLYDAVALVLAKEKANEVAAIPQAKDFVTDAHAHSKFIIYNEEAMPLIKEANLEDKMDAGYLSMLKADSDAIVRQLRALRFWER